MNLSPEADQQGGRQRAAGSQQSLCAKFRSAFRGLGRGLRQERNFRVHGLIATAVVAAGYWLGVSSAQWCLLVLCISSVLAAELFNTALERLARTITRNYHADIEDALDIASAAVLVAACGAAIVGAAILGQRLGVIAGWW
jgi:diacylglycerol kinase